MAVPSVIASVLIVPAPSGTGGALFPSQHAPERLILRKALSQHMSLPAFIVTALAIFAVAAGSATAASLITSANIKDESIQNRDLRNGAFTLSKLRASTIAVLKADNQLTLNRIAALEAKAGIPGPNGTNGTGATGAAGAKGDKGDKGDAGSNGAAGPQGPTGPTGPADTSDTTTVNGSNAAAQGFTSGNSSVKYTDDGVTFGPYTTNNAGTAPGGSPNAGGSLVLRSSDLVGRKLRDIRALAYTARYTVAAGTKDVGDAPYLRVILNDGDDRFVFSPSTQPGACSGPGGGASSPQCASSGKLVRYNVINGTVRYNNDAGGVLPGAPDPDDDPALGQDTDFDTLIKNHGDDVISELRVTTGFSQPGTASGLVSRITYELLGGQPMSFDFGS